MQLSDLLEHPHIQDVITTETTIFLITDGKETPEIYTDKHVVHVPAQELLQHERLADMLGGTSIRNPHAPQRLQPVILYEYVLNELPRTKKQAFSHKLYGTGGRRSQLEDLEGERVGKAAFYVPQEHREDAEQFLNEHQVSYTTRTLLLREAGA